MVLEEFKNKYDVRLNDVVLFEGEEYIVREIQAWHDRVMIKNENDLQLVEPREVKKFD